MPFLNDLSNATGLVGYTRLPDVDQNEENENNANNNNNRVEVEEPKPVPVPLEDVKLKVRVINLTAQVEVEQSYVNTESTPIECVYFFPVEASAAVVKFTAELNGRSVKTTVKEVELAKKEYQKAVEEKKTAVQMSQVKSDIFQIKVGHLGPNEKCKISLTYISELPIEPSLDDKAEKVRLTIPTTVASRYVPESDKSEEAKQISSIKHSSDGQADLSFELEVFMKTEIKEVASPSHNLSLIERVKKDNYYQATTKFVGKTTDMDRDLVVLIDSEENNKPKILIEKDFSGSLMAMLSFVPNFDHEKHKIEAVFLVDCSGSMSGKSMELAKKALQVFLNSLPEDSFFNIVLFGSSFKSLYTESKRYNSDTLEEAKNFHKKIAANLGGTEIYSPLEFIFRQNIKSHGGEKYYRQVFVLTDGQVSNTSACIDLVGRNSKANRVYTLGVGYSADRDLVGGMARAGNGAAAYTTGGESITPKVVQQLKNSLHSSVSHVTIDWGGLEVGNPNKPGLDQAPAYFPAVENGQRIVLYKLLKDKLQPGTKITFTAQFGNRQMIEEFEVTEKSFIGGEQLHKLYARKKIQEVKETYQGWSGRNEKKEIITSLGLQYELVTEYTAFIGVDTREAPANSAPMVSRQVPNMAVKNTSSEGDVLPVMAPGGDWSLRHMMTIERGHPGYVYDDTERGAGAFEEEEFDDLVRGAGANMSYMKQRNSLLSHFSLMRDDDQVRGIGGNMKSKKESCSFASGIVKTIGGFFSSGKALQNTPEISRGAVTRQRSLPADISKRKTNEIMSQKNQEALNEMKSAKLDESTRMDMEDRVTLIISHQESNGCFQPNGGLSRDLGSPLDSRIKTLSLNKEEATVWTTYLVVNLLKQNFQPVKDVWELVVDKAEAWLFQNKIKLDEKQKKEAKKFIESNIQQK